MANAAPSTKTSTKKDEEIYYHYTDKESAIKIVKSGIKQSTDTQNDARYGKGTYLTKLDPSEPRATVAKNNYDGGYEAKLNKTDAVLQVKTTAVKVSEERDVYKHDGDIPKENIQKVCYRNEKGTMDCTDIN